jgi:hypothetical protein
MVEHESRYFTLSLESLRAIGRWAAACAERALPIYERQTNADARPRAAIAGIRDFAAGGKRAARLRTLALAAHAAAREIGDPAAAAAARAAGLAAASAYTHPLADVHQTKHIVGPAAYAALARELDGGDPSLADDEVRWAIAQVTAEVRDVLLQMPARQPGKSRLDRLLYELDAGIRASPSPAPCLTGANNDDHSRQASPLAIRNSLSSTSRNNHMDEERKSVTAAEAGIHIQDFRDINDALSACADATGLILTEHDLAGNFFDLRSGLAGEVFQKFTNYQVRLAIVVPDPAVYGRRFSELAYEHRTHNLIRIVPSVAAAHAWMEG